MTPLYTAEARAQGGRDGKVETSDGKLTAALAMPKELGGNGQGTNPEQLFAAGYAACFESAQATCRSAPCRATSASSPASAANLLGAPLKRSPASNRRAGGCGRLRGARRLARR